LPGKNGKIAFLRGYPQKVYAINPDGSGETRLTPEHANSSMPVWSPDGERLAFRSDGDGLDNSYNLFAVRASGSGLTQLTGFYDPSPSGASWSPDAMKLTFSVGDLVYTVRADGTGLTSLVAGGGPDWSPDGTEIAYTDEAGRIVTMKPDGSDHRIITSGGGPRWSPDGSRMAFTRSAEIHVIDADGSDERNLRAAGWGLDWSPDGKWIAYQDNTGPNTDVYVVDTETGARRRLTDDPGFDAGPAWSPDGTRIAFVSVRGAFDSPTMIRTMRADGSDDVPLAQGHNGPQWQRIPPPVRSDYRNAAHYCKAERDFLGASRFEQKYGTNGRGASAHGKCVSG
jgi:Tol biopolymer transport system component